METYYSEYYDEEVTKEEMHNSLADYLEWCDSNSQKPEVESLDDLTPGLINHVLYHARL